MVIDVKEAVFTEKYRPNSVDNVIGDFVPKIKKYLENPESIPNFLFHSVTPGSGKTSMAKAIINDLDCDYLMLNSSDDRKIETIRDKVKDFSKTVSYNGRRKCCFLDEFDGMLKDSQNALRNIMETYSDNIFFILTCNNIQKIIPAIQSRCVTIEFSRPDKTQIKERLKKICESEKIIYQEDGLDKIIELYYPSIRNMVNKLQDLLNDNKEVAIENIQKDNEYYNNLWSLIKQQKYEEVKNVIISKGIDTEELNKNIFYYLMKQSVSKTEIQIIPIFARNERDFKLGADPHIIFIASVIDMIKIFRANNVSNN